MIITQTPVRLSFLGGGTDYPVYFRQHGGTSLTTTIDKYVLISVHPLTQFADHCVRVHYSRIEAVKSIDEIQHPSARECLRFMGINEGVEIHYINDLPARTGLGSSSAATVGLLHALHAFKGEMASNEQIAAEAVYVEQELVKERVGCQDQYAVAIGGLLCHEFAQDGSVKSNPIVLATKTRAELQSNLLLFYTGIQRHAHDVVEEQLARTDAGHNATGLEIMKSLVNLGIQRISSGDNIAEFGALLHEAWMIKRGLSSKITTSWIDEVYERARKAGATGGKLLGAGGGGFLLLYVEPDQQERVRSALPELRETTFNFENAGSRVIFYRP